MKIQFASVIMVAAISLAACSNLKEDKTIHAFFFTQRTNANNAYNLFINDTLMGKVSSVSRAISCADDVIKKTVLTLNIQPGIKRIKITNSAGQIISAGTMELGEDNMTLKGEAGGMDARQTDNCLMVEVL